MNFYALFTFLMRGITLTLRQTANHNHLTTFCLVGFKGDFEVGALINGIYLMEDWRRSDDKNEC